MLAGLFARCAKNHRSAGVVEVRLGRETTGSDTFPMSDDRALLSPFVLSAAMSVVLTGHARFAAGTTAGSSAKFLVMSDNAGAPGTLLAISGGVAVPAGGGLVNFTFTGGPALPVGTYWLGIVAESFQGVFSHQTGAPGGTMVMANGTFPFASTAGYSWPGTSATYGSQACAYIIGNG